MSLLPSTHAVDQINGSYDYFFVKTGGIQSIVIPSGYAENRVSTPIPGTTPVLIATGNITLTTPSRIWANSSSVFQNTATGTNNNYLVTVYHRINSVNYNTTTVSIPTRYSSTVPASVSVAVQEITQVFVPGTYTVEVYAYANETNTTLIEAHTDICMIGSLF